MKKIASTGYSSTYENDCTNETGDEYGFGKFWEGCFKESKKEILNSLQTNFYFRAYAKNAINKLIDMEFPFPANAKYKPAIYGMIFSIMEARYRDKNINGKLNLELKVAEGDLWPFLVNLKGLEKVKRTGSEGNYHYKIDGHEINREDWPDLNEVVDGAYQWMSYYESEFMESTSASTVSMSLIQEEADDDANSADWEAEYMELTNEEELPSVDNSFYDRVSMVRSTFKKNSDNQYGLFGAEEEYTIESELTLTEAMEKMKTCMKETFDASLWEGLQKYNIERTYMLAKNIVQNERLQSEYSYYNIGTNIIDSTPGEEGNEYLLKDFQKVKLELPVKGKDRKDNNCDTDKDGLKDNEELLDADPNVDVTGFIETMLRNELIGRGVSATSIDEDILQGAMATLRNNLINERKKTDNEEAGVNIFGAIVDKIKNLLNNVNQQEVNEHYLRAEGDKFYVTLYDYRSNPVLKDTDFDGLSDYEERPETGLNPLDSARKGKVYTDRGEIDNANTHMDYRYFFMNNKVYYDELSTMSLLICNALENYGKDDKNGTDDFVNLDTLLKNIGMWNTESKVDEALDEYGTEGLLKPKKSKVNYVTGTHDIEYTHNYNEKDKDGNIVKPITKKVKLIAIQSIEKGQGNIENVGNNKREKGYNVYTKANHDTFDKLANSIYAKEYVNDPDVCYWVIGHGTGGAIANILAAKLIQSGRVYISGKEDTREYIQNAYVMYDDENSNVYDVQVGNSSQRGKVISNVYAYTFGAPYTVYSGSDYLNQGNSAVPCHSDIFCSIFNVQNEDDILAYMPSSLLGWDRYGARVMLSTNNINADYRTTEDAVSKIKAFDNSSGYEYKGYKERRVAIEKAFYDIFTNADGTFSDNMRENYYEINKKLPEIFKDIIQEFMEKDGNLTGQIAKISSGAYDSLDAVTQVKVIQFIMQLSTYNTPENVSLAESVGIDTIKEKDEAILYAKDTGGYYYLSKALRPENVSSMKLDNSDVKSNHDKSAIPIKSTLDDLGQWYVDNVYTYLAGNYGAIRGSDGTLKMYDDDNDEKHTKESWHFPIDDDTYKTNFISRFKTHYKNANGVDTATKKSVKTKRKEYITNKNSDLNENYLDGLNGNQIDVMWATYETCGRDIRGATCSNASGESVIKGTNQRGRYTCDKLDGNTAQDDCSAFASEVIWKFIHDNKIGKYEEYTKPSYWGSYDFQSTKVVKDKLEKYGFKCYDSNEISKNKDFKLQFGDLLCRKSHVEFYKGEFNSKSFGWGSVHDSYINNPGIMFEKQTNGTFKGDKNSKDYYYTRVYRFVGKVGE